MEQGGCKIIISAQAERGKKQNFVRRTVLERPAIEGDSPVCENGFVLVLLFLSTAP